MSFSAQVKEELNLLAIKGNCCKKAFIFGVALASEITEQGIRIKLTDNTTADHFSILLKTIYNVIPERKEIRRGCYFAVELTFKAHKILDFLKFADEFSDMDDEDTFFDSYFKCDNCRSVFLRGVFCAVGTVSDPQKSYSLELRLPNDMRAMLVHSMLESIGPEAPGITQRNGGFGIFYRNESAVEYALSLCGATKTVFSFFNAHIEKDLRNLENRATNCVTRNIAKSVDAASAQINAIDALMVAGMLEELSDDIKVTAELRMQNPDLSLSELASIHTPPISKSGLNHRLKKLTEFAQKRNLI